VYYVDKERGWSVAAGGTFIPREFRVSEDFVSPEWAQLAESAVRQAGPVPKTPYRFLSTTFLALPEMFQAMLASARGDLTRATAQLQLDSRDEVMMVTQACCVLNCANVETRDFLPNPRLNAARLAKGKQPFFTYKVLQLEDTTPAKSVSAGGTHAAPRAHLRRGHIRHLASGRDVWVRNTLVNAGTSAGVVVKDYRLSPPDDGKAPL